MRQALASSGAALAIAVSSLASPETARAQDLPTGGQVVAGSVTIAGDRQSLQISQTSDRAVINWRSFDIAQGASVEFRQPDSGSAVLNRVTGDTPSSIAGTLTANGQVFLVNPNGIALTSTGAVAIDGGFVASTLDIADADFMAGNLRFAGSGTSASVSNAGTVTIGQGGFAALLGGTVANSGTIAVPLGRIALGSGEAATLDPYGDGFLQVAIPTAGNGTDPLISMRGRLAGARVELRAASAREAVRQAINLPGRIEARTVRAEGGAIILDGGEGETQIAGRLDAHAADGAGGSILVGGRSIVLTGAGLDASGARGGTVAVGGGALGAPVAGLAPSARTLVDGSSTIDASGKAGAGGSVTVWGTDALAYGGTVIARGEGADGGSAEISGLGSYLYTGTVDLLSHGGQTGTLLLDPYNLTISSSAASNVSGFTATGNSAVVNVTTLQNSLATANVVVSTGSSGTQTGTITVASAITWNAPTTLTLSAAGGIVVNSGRNITATGGGGMALTTAAGTISVTSATLSTNSGTIALTSNAGGAGNGITLSNATINAGTGSATLTGTSNSAYGIQIAASTTLTTSGTVSLIGTSGTSDGINVATAGVLRDNAGNLTFTGTGTSGSGVSFSGGAQSIINNGSGSVAISGSSNSLYGIRLNSHLTTTGTVSIAGTSVGHYGMFLSGTTITSNSGDLTLSGTSTANGMWFQASASLVNNGAGTLRLNGTSGINNGIRFNTNANLSTTGTVVLNGVATDIGGGLSFKGGNSITIVSGTPSFSGTSLSGAALLFQGATTINNQSGAQVTLAGTSTNGAGLQLPTGSIVSVVGGNVKLSGTSTASYGVEIDGAGGTPVALSTAISSNLVIEGNSTDGNGVGLLGDATTTNAGTGIAIAGGSSAPSALGVTLASGAAVGSTGGLTLTDTAASTAVAAIDIAGQLSTSSGALTLAPASGNGIHVASGGSVASTGAGTINLTANGTGAIVNDGTIAQDAGGSGAIVLTTADGLLGGSGTISGGSTAGAITLRALGAGNVAHGAGTIVQAGGGAISLSSLAGAVDGGTISYTGSSGGTLTVSAAGTAILAAPVSAGTNTLDVTVSGASVELGSAIGSNGGNIAVTGPVTLTGDSSLDAGAGALSFSGPVDGAHDLTLKGSSIFLGGAIGGSTAAQAVDIVSAQGLTLPSIGATSIVARATDGGATLALASGTSLVASGSGTSLVLSGDMFANNAGAAALDAPNGRWLIFSAAPSGDLFSGLDSGQTAIWNTNWATSGGDISQAGNRYVFAYRPTLTFSSASLSKTYGADGAAALASSYTVSGFASGVAGAYLADDAASAWSGAPALASSGAATTAMVAGSPYGISIAAGTLSSAAGYDLAFASPGQLTVTPAPLTIVAGDAAKTYDGLAFSGGNGLHYAGFVNGDTQASLSGTLAWGGTAQGAVDAGSYGITASGLANPNYTIDWQAGTLTVDRAPLSLTYAADPASSVYGASLAGLSGTIAGTGFVNGEGLADLSGAAAWTTSATAGTDAGSYAISGSGLASTNYAITAMQASGNASAYSVTPAPLTIVAGDAAKTYDGLAFSGGNGLHYAGFVNGDTQASLSGTLAWGGTAQGVVDAGSYGITASGLANPNYTIDWQAGTLTVDRAPLSLTYAADNVSSVYGASLAGLSGTVTGTGFVNGEGLADLSGAAAWTTSATAGTDAGSYAINGAGLASTNYAITATQASGNAGAYTVTPAPLTIVASDAAKTYDGLAFSGGNGLHYAGFVNGDTQASLSGTLVWGGTAQGGVDAGGYGIIASGLANPNYAIAWQAGTLTVDRAPLSLTYAADPASSIYGASLADLSGTVTGTGFVNGEGLGDLSGVASWTNSAVPGADAGSYAIHGAGLVSSNYAITAMQASGNASAYSVTPAPLTIVAGDAAKTYDGLAFSGGNGLHYAGFVNGDTQASLSGTLVWGGTAQGVVDAGSYGIIASGLANPNYAITWQAGTLTVDRAPLSLTYAAAPVSSIYGAGLAGLSGTVVGSGFVNGEGLGDLSGTAGWTTSAGTGADVGSYAIHGAGLTSTNYAITAMQASGNASAYSVTPAPLTIVAGDAAKTYDGLAFSGGNGLHYAGFVNGDTQASLSGTLVWGGTAQGVVDAGSYGIIASGLANPNYAITWQAGTLTVDRAPLSLTYAAAPVSSIYGAGLAGLSGTVVGSGFVNGEGLGDLSGTAGWTTSAGTGADVGSYAIHGAGLTSTNYAITATQAPGNAGAYTVTPAPLTIVAGDAAKTYDGLAFSGGNGLHYAGFVNGDTQASLSGTLAWGGTAQGAIDAGSYGITASGLANPNYTIDWQAGTLTVDRAPLSLTYAADPASSVYGASLAGLSGTVTGTGFVNGEGLGDLAGVANWTGSVSVGTDAGSYAINGAGLASTNYAITATQASGNAGAYTVTPAPLTIVASDAAKTYDGLAFSGGNGLHYAGFVNGDTQASLSGTLAWGGTAQGAVDAGSYGITASGLANPNYTIDWQAGTLTVDRAPLSLTYAAAPVSSIYGAGLAGLSGTVVGSGFVNGEGLGDLSGTAGWTTSAGTGADVGSYAIHGAGLTSANYAITAMQASGNASAYSVTPAPLTIVAGDAAKTYDGLAFSGGNGLHYAGFVNGDTQASLSGTLVWGGTAQGAVDAGSYGIIASGLTNPNYAITWQVGTLRIFPNSPVIGLEDILRADQRSCGTGMNGSGRGIAASRFLRISVRQTFGRAARACTP